MYVFKSVLFTLFWGIFEVNCFTNITILHLHDNNGYSKEAVHTIVAALNANEEFDVSVDLYQSVEINCADLLNAHKNVDFHLILSTRHTLDDGYIVHTDKPFISTQFQSSNLYYKPDNFYRFKPPLESMERLIIDMVKSLQINNVLIAYNPETCFLYNFQERLRQIDVLTFLYELSPNNPLYNIKKLNYDHVIYIHDGLFPSTTLYEMIAFDKTTTWYVITLHETNLTAKLVIAPKFNKKLVNEIPEIVKKNDLMYQFYSDVAFLAVNMMKKLADESEEVVRWIGCMDNPMKPNYVDFTKYLDERNVVYNQFSLDDLSGGYDFAMSLRNPRLNEIVDEWSTTDGLKKQWKEASSPGMNHYKILALIKPPFVYYNESSTVPFYGYCIDMLKDLARILKFTYQLTPGYSTDEIKKGHFDVALGGIKATAKLSLYVDFTEPFYKPVGIGILVKRSLSSGIFKFITVMESTVWMCVIGAYFLNSFLIWAFERFSPFSYRNKPERYMDDEDDNRDFTLRESLWFCIMSITPQGGGNVPKHLSGRMAVITWWIFGFIVLSSYTANLAAFLTLSKLNSDVESFEALTKQYKLQYSVVNNTDEQEFFMNFVKLEKKLDGFLREISYSDSYMHMAPFEYTLETTYEKLVNAMKNATFPSSLEEGLERVLNPDDEEFALIGEMSDIKYLEMRHCGLEVVGNELSRIPYAFAVRKRSFLGPLLSRGITELMLTRRLDELEKKWWDDNEEKATGCPVGEDHWKGVGVQNIGGVFFIILVGISMACLTITYEYIKYTAKERRAGKVQVLQAEEAEPAEGRGSHVSTPETVDLNRIERY